MKKTIAKLLPCLALCALMAMCLTACGSSGSASSSSSSASSSSTATATDALANTTWTAEVGEDYGAATQGDDDEALTTLTLHFTDEGTAYNVVGDISFDYVLNDDGTIDVSNLDLGETGISKDGFELSYTDGSLVLEARINGGNATLTFEQEQEGSDSAAADELDGTTWTAEIGEDYGAETQGDDDEELTSLTLHFADGTASNVVGDISFDYELNEDGTIDVSNLDLGETGISKDGFELSYKDGSLVLEARINGGNATLTFEQE